MRLSEFVRRAKADTTVEFYYNDGVGRVSIKRLPRLSAQQIAQIAEDRARRFAIKRGHAREAEEDRLLRKWCQAHGNTALEKAANAAPSPAARWEIETSFTFFRGPIDAAEYDKRKAAGALAGENVSMQDTEGRTARHESKPRDTDADTPWPGDQFGIPLQAKLSKEDANYREAEDKRTCGTCSFFQKATGGCDLVEGDIKAEDTCDAWHSFGEERA